MFGPVKEGMARRRKHEPLAHAVEERTPSRSSSEASEREIALCVSPRLSAAIVVVPRRAQAVKASSSATEGM